MDDVFTLTIRDNLMDEAGNKLDGERCRRLGVRHDPCSPPGNGVPGGNFVAQLWVDSLPEVGVALSAGVQIDMTATSKWP